MHSFRIACLATGLALVGCGKKKDDVPMAKPDEVIAKKNAIPPMEVEPKVAQALGTDVNGMVGRLNIEAHNRPKAGILAEQVFDALDKADIVILKREQYFGYTLNASFCAGGKTASNLQISMCEYTDQKTAEAGLAFMNKHFNASTAQRAVHKAAVLTVVELGKQPDVAKKAIDTFLAL